MKFENMPTIDYRPLAFYISYATLLDNCLVKFIDDFNDDFGYDDTNDIWILQRQLSKKKLEKIFSEYLSLELQRILLFVERKWESIPNKLFFICDNGLSLQNYYLEERDIAIDLESMKIVWNKIFSQWLKAGHDHNIVFCKHNELLDIDWLFDILQDRVFGRRRVVDLTLDIKSGMKSTLHLEHAYTPNLKFKSNDPIVKECVQWVNGQIESNILNKDMKKHENRKEQ